MPRVQSRFRAFEPTLLLAACTGALTLGATACGDSETSIVSDTVSQQPTTGAMPTTPPAATGAAGTTPASAAPATQPAATPEPQEPPPVSTPVTPSEPVTPEPAEAPPPALQPPALEPMTPMPTAEAPGEMPAPDMTPAEDPTDPVAMPEPEPAEPEPEPAPAEGASNPMPSPGCNGGNPNATVPSSVVDMPSGYDGSTPAPVFFAFHGAGGNSSSLQGPFASTAKERGYIGIYLKSTDSAWNVRTDTPLLDDAYNAVLDNYCVDINRVFAIGHSSGAQMITQLLCNGDTRFRAVAPVASSKYCNGWDPTAAIVIHGLDDIERGGQGEMRYGLNDGDGAIDFGVYHDSNQCTEATTSFDPGGNCGANIDPGCVTYDDCAAPTVFCNHNDPQYGTSNHGVPCFAGPVVFDFFDQQQ